MPKKSLQAESFPTIPANFGMNNARVIVYDATRGVNCAVCCVGCRGTSFWVPNWPRSLNKLSEDCVFIQCSRCKIIDFVPVCRFLRVEKQR